MGQYLGRKPNGAPVVFRIKGDAPSQTEMARINAYMTQGPPQPATTEEPPKEEAIGPLTALGRGAARFWNETQAGVDRGMQGFYETLGDRAKAKEWEEAAQEQLAERDRYKLPEGSFLESDNKTAQLAGTLGQSAGPIVAGAAAGTLVGGPVGALVGAGVGTVAALPQLFSSNTERQIEEHGRVKDWGKAVGATAFQGAIEGVSQKITFGLAGLGGKVGSKVVSKEAQAAIKRGVEKAATTLVGRVGFTMAEVGLMEAAEEVVQQGAERWQAEMELLDPEAQAEYLESAVVGGLLGLGFGGAAGYVRHRKDKNHDAKIKAAEEDIAAEAADASRRKREFEPQYAQNRKAPYIDEPPPAPTEEKPIIAGQLPDYSGETYVQKLLEKKETQLPPGLRDDEVEGPKPSAPSGPATPPPSAPASPHNVPERVGEKGMRLIHGTGDANLTQQRRVSGLFAHSEEDLQHVENIAAKAGGTATVYDLDIAPNTIIHREPGSLANLTPKRIKELTDQGIGLAVGTGQNGRAEYSVLHRGAIRGMTPRVAAPASTTSQPGSAPTETKVTATPRIGEQGPVAKPFSEDEYRNAIGVLRDEGSLSVDKIAKKLGVSRPTAQAYFNEMRDRNDAYPAGSQNQYLKITVPHGMGSRKMSDVRGKQMPQRSRDYIVKPVQPANLKPFSVSVNGKKRGKGLKFTTREEAQAWIEKNINDKHKKNATVETDPSGLQFGIHELQYEHMPNKEQRLVGERVVNTYSSREEADAAVKDYDPAYSPESNKHKDRMTAEQKQAAIEQDFKQSVGPIYDSLKKYADSVLGKGKGDVGIVPSISHPDKPDAVIEGVAQTVQRTDPVTMKKVITNLITLAHDLYSPNMTVEQRAQKMEEVLNHELIHALRSLDLLTPQEWDILYKHAVNNKVPGKPYTWMERSAVRARGQNPGVVMEEAIAEMARHYMNDPTAFRNPERSLLRKIADFIKRLMRLGERHDAADLLDTIFSGGVADREIGSGGLGPRSEKDAFYSLLKPDNFYLKTQRNWLDTVRQEKAPVDQWKGMLKNASIPKEERAWLGIEDWLDEIKKDKPVVTKAEIQEFINASSGISVKVLAKRSHPELGQSITSGGYSPQYGKMQTSGGQDYAEALFYFSPKEGDPTYETNHFMYVPGLKEEDNLLAHARFKTVVDPDGKRILFIEEIQSDLHQEANRVGGYYSENMRQALEEADRLANEADEETRRLWKVEQEAYRTLGDKQDHLDKVRREIRFHEKNNTRSYVNMATLNEQQTRLSRQVTELHDQLTETRKRREAARQTANEASHQYQQIRKRMHIPNAPFKTGWEDYVIKRLLRHALEHDFDGIAWHGQPESVAAAESWGPENLVTRQTERGTSYFVTHPFLEDEKNVSTIINRYLEKLPRIVRKIGSQFGIGLDMMEASPNASPATKEGQSYEPPGYEDEDQIMEEFPTKKEIKRLYNRMKARQDRQMNTIGADPDEAADQGKLLAQVAKAHQIALTQHQYNPADAFHKARLISWDERAGIYNAKPLQEATIWARPNGDWADVINFRGGPVSGNQKTPKGKGAFPWKHFRMNFTNPAMAESFEKGDQPLFSMLQERKEQIVADPKFQRWFGKGVVTDDEGEPKVVYHSTRADENFSRFNRMTHWGTVLAANDRLDAAFPEAVSGSAIMDMLGIDPMIRDKFWASLEPHERQKLFENYWKKRHQYMTSRPSRIYPAFINLRRPLHIFDTGVQHGVKDYALAAYHAGALNEKEVTSIQRRTHFVSKEFGLSKFIDLLEKKGYDGLSYVNNAEDEGSMSYVTFRPNQQKSIFNNGAWSDDPDIMYSMLEERGADLLENNDKFKKWFSGSKIVDENGNPYLMFHGTGRNFDTFDEEWLRKGMGTTDYGRGFYFSQHPEEASGYAGNLKRGKNGSLAMDPAGGHVIPAYLSIKNPYIWPANKGRLFSGQEATFLTKKLKAAGHDGVIVYDTGFDEYGDPEGPRAEENGIAEIVAFYPNQIKSALAEEFSLENDSFQYSMLEPQYSAAAPTGQRVPLTAPIDQLSEVHNRMTYDNLPKALHKLLDWAIPGKATVLKEKVDDTFIGLQDRMLSVGRLIDRIKKNGGFISNENDTYLREQLYSSQVDAHLTANDRDFYKPMMETISGLSVTRRDYEEARQLGQRIAQFLDNYKVNHKHALAELYLYAQHAQERNAEMQKRNERVAGDRPLQYEHGSGMGDGEAQAVLQWFASKPFAGEFMDPTRPTSVRSRMRAIVKSTNDVRVAAGLNPDFRTMAHPNIPGRMVDNYQDYVPIRGFLGEASLRDEDTEEFAKTGKGFNIRGKEDFAALGRESMGVDIIAHAIMQNQESIVRGGKNKVAQSFHQLILDNPAEMADTAEIVQMPRTKYQLRDGLVRQVVDNTVQTDPTVLKGKIDGQQFYIKMKDPRIIKAMGTRSGLGTGGSMPAFIKSLAKVNRVLAATRTSWNPEFVISNMLRDLEAAMVNLSEHKRKGLRRKVMSSVLPAFKGIVQAVRSGDMTSEWAKVHEEFRRHGGHTAAFGIRDLDHTIDRINKEFAEDVSGNPKKVLKPIRTLGKFIEDYNLAVENGTRLAAYKVLRDEYLQLSGDPMNPQNQLRAKEMAAFAAKNLTVNFNMGGEHKPVLTAFYMFFNASMQGSLALLNPFIRSGRMRKMWLGVLTFGAMQDMLMSILSPEDDDGEKTYDKIPQHILEHNLVFLDPFGMSERGYFKFPLPYLMNGIYNWGRAASRTARGKYTTGEFMETGFMTMVDSLNPWGGSNSFLNFVAPTAIDPVVDLYQNEDFTGKPIAPPLNPFDNTGENRSQQYWNNTNPAYVGIADWLSYLTGRKGDYIPGYAEYSPNQVEYVMDWISGGTGPFLARAGRLLYGGATGDFGEAEVEAGDIPFARKVYGSVTSKNDLQDYIEGRDQVLRIRKALQDARKEGDNELYLSIMRRYPKEYKVAARVNALENARKKLGSKIKKIRDNKRMTEERKEEVIKSLKERQDNLVGRGNEVLAAID